MTDDVECYIIIVSRNRNLAVILSTLLKKGGVIPFKTYVEEKGVIIAVKYILRVLVLVVIFLIVFTMKAI